MPLYRLGRQLLNPIVSLGKAGLRRLAGCVLRRLVWLLVRNPKIRVALVSLSGKLGIKELLRGLYFRFRSDGNRERLPKGLRQLSPRARLIYTRFETMTDDSDRERS